ncbi:MAG: hypothetical protein R3E96_00910 [Planctomycetota bacterium]
MLARFRGATTRLGVTDLEVEVDKGKVRGVHTRWFLRVPERRAGHGLLDREHPRDPRCRAAPQGGAYRRGLAAHAPGRRVVEDEFNMAAAESELETRFRPDPLEMMPVPHPVILDPTRKFGRCEPTGAARASVAWA